jgi:3-deoxy-7-phosphoheptulonate synthase
LPALVEAVRKIGRTVLWVVDPMHGNTEEIEGGIKTRRFDKILSELEQHLTSMKALAVSSEVCISNLPAKM